MARPHLLQLPLRQRKPVVVQSASADAPKELDPLERWAPADPARACQLGQS
jgi:hypothetical protein